MLSTNSEQPKKCVDYSPIVERKSYTRWDCRLHQVGEDNFGNKIVEEKNYVEPENCAIGAYVEYASIWFTCGLLRSNHLIDEGTTISFCRSACRLSTNVMSFIDRIRDRILLS